MYKALKFENKIKLIISDFDGVFTDGTVFVGKDGQMFKQISYKDIMGVSIAVKNGLIVAFLSGEISPAIDFMANKFDLKDVFQGIRDKTKIVVELMNKYSLQPENVLYVGDDINDIESMLLVANRVAPSNACEKVKQVEKIQITQNSGGQGVFREIVDNLVR